MTEAGLSEQKVSSSPKLLYTNEDMYTVAAYYRFLSLADPVGLREELREAFVASNLLGTTLIAPEGINGTMAGSAETIDRLLRWLREQTGLDCSEVKFSTTEKPPFGG